MTSGSRSSPAMTSAGSPGRSCCSKKMITDRKNSVGTSCSSRLPRNVSMARSASRRSPKYRRPLSELQPDHAHQAVRHLSIALEPSGMGDQYAPMIQVENRRVLEHGLGQLLVDRLALRHFGGNARFVEQLVGVRIAIAGIIQRRLALVEVIGVAVGIGAAAPAEQIGLIFAGL